MVEQQWLERWQTGNTSFNMSEPNELMIQYFSVLALQANDTVLVPLCGASIDMRYLLEQGYRVIGSELSEIACQQFFLENKLYYDKMQDANFTVYKGDNITLFCGDFFSLTPEHTGKINAIYDRAALIALPADERDSYAAKLQELMPDFDLFLLSVTHDSADGPPFSICKDKIEHVFSTIELTELASSTQTNTIDLLLSRGLVNVKEIAYRLRKL